MTYNPFEKIKKRSLTFFSQELETNDPDFIVVYDLQSGTLFKKWKSGSNTVALTIGCQNTCVVTSLHDGRILVWDLGTGIPLSFKY